MIVLLLCLLLLLFRLRLLLATTLFWHFAYRNFVATYNHIIYGGIAVLLIALSLSVCLAGRLTLGLFGWLVSGLDIWRLLVVLVVLELCCLLVKRSMNVKNRENIKFKVKWLLLLLLLPVLE